GTNKDRPTLTSSWLELGGYTYCPISENLCLGSVNGSGVFDPSGYWIRGQPMQSYPRVFLLILIPLCDLAGLSAAQPDAPARPNVVLSTAVHFTGPDGRDVTVVPGRYFVEQAGATALRLTPMGEGKSFMIQAQSV